MTLYWLDIGQITTIPGTQMIRQVELCQDIECERGASKALPYFSSTSFDATIETQQLRIRLTRSFYADGMMAFYFPKLTGLVELRLNGHVIFVIPDHRRLWDEPLLIPVAPVLLTRDANVLDITLSGPQSERLDLHPFFFGRQDLLIPYHNLRFLLGPGFARFALGLMTVVATSLLVIWSFRRQETEYLWLGLACATAMPTLIQYGYGIGFGGYRLWTILWILSVSLYVLLIVKFLRCFLKLPFLWPERTHGVLLGLSVVTILFVPQGYVYSISLWSNVLITVPSSIVGITTLWINRKILTPLDIRVFFPCLSIAVALGFYALYLLLLPAPSRTMHLFQLMPLVMALACIWLILSRLILSLRSSEALTASLTDTIARKSAELEASFAELTEVKRREAIAEERDRIMLDLHDGIGGHLVSALAYMENNNAGDEKIRHALEDALRDLALMLDSMENHDSLVTLLGMLRTRLEDLLSAHGIEFDWQVHGEPVLPNPGPSQSLHLARIVQEAITNVIKHAGADTITIFVDENEIRVSDNGKGFDLDQLGTSEHPANGIANMKRRSAAIGAQFSLTSDATGTNITLLLIQTPERT
ncbi:sensor histidine kinase [Halovulum sp. GXIMD14793]